MTTLKTIRNVLSLVKLFDCDKGQDVNVFNITRRMIEESMGRNSEEVFLRHIDTNINDQYILTRSFAEVCFQMGQAFRPQEE